MKKNKIELSDLKVKSFVTGLEKDNVVTVKGGSGKWCSDVPNCEETWIISLAPYCNRN